MKKRILSLALALLLMLGMTGCQSQAAKDVEAMIASVSAGDTEALAKAVAAYEGLAEKDREAVGNLHILEAAREAVYHQAGAMMDEKKYEEAVALFNVLGDYQDSKEAALFPEKQYDEALALRDSGAYEEAKALFLELGAYGDAEEQVLETIYLQGKALLEEKNYLDGLNCLQSLGDYKDSAEIAEAAAGEAGLYGLDQGDVYEMGTYEQDGDAANGAEPLSWVVLAKEEDRVLLLSQKIIEAMEFHDVPEGAVWEEASIRQWLNDTFYAAAFTAEEQETILLSKLTNPANPEFGTSSGEDTEDSIFLLSLEEYSAYTELAGETEVTPYTQAEYDRKASFGYPELWWLRTAGAELGRPVYVVPGGYISNQPDGFGCYGTQGIRPAMWVKLG